MDSFRRIIDLWPSFQALGKDVQESDSTVYKWHMRDNIPADSWLILTLAAEQRGYRNVTPERLMRLAAKEQKPAKPAKPAKPVKTAA